MDLSTDNRPENCAKLGLDCGNCIRQAAASVASVCQQLDSGGAQQIFFQMYSSPACHAMAPNFELAYCQIVDEQRQTRFAFASAAA